MLSPIVGEDFNVSNGFSGKRTADTSPAADMAASRTNANVSFMPAEYSLRIRGTKWSMFNSQFPILIRVEGAKISFRSDENWELRIEH
jgi:hypothetical protein